MVVIPPKNITTTHIAPKVVEVGTITASTKKTGKANTAGSHLKWLLIMLAGPEYPHSKQ